MDREKIRELLSDLSAHKVTPDEAFEQLKSLPYEDLDWAKVDTHRALRKGFAEVVLCTGKTDEQVAKIVQRLSSSGAPVLATRAKRSVFEAVRGVRDDAVYHETARIVVVGKPNSPVTDKQILIVSAGTSDLPVAEEAAITAETMGNRIERLYDVGVAGIHRLLGNLEKLRAANVLVVVAGMEGALPSIVGGIVDRPVIAVPTSVGYGASFGGLSALLGMLNSCAPGVVVVNIDNGFGAGYAASVMNRMGE
ncbi:nickel pincer cofactor biosynthesis protein LarB [bacterium]|nr:nickel pincer cofactor biosynthesis protein LarB [bacterium]